MVKNSDIPILKEIQFKVLIELEADMKANVRRQGEELQNRLYEQSVAFIDGIVNDLNENVKHMKELLQDKEENLTRYEKFLGRLEEAKKLLREESVHKEAF